MSDLLTKLGAPFPPDVVSWRVGSMTKDKTKGMALAYLDSRDVQDRLNAVCGADWQVRHPWSVGMKLACEIGIKIDGEWVWRGDGAGDSDVEAEKGAFSDSFKRAAVRWNIGRYLYDLGATWVDLETKGSSHVIAEREHARLRKILVDRAGRGMPDASSNTMNGSGGTPSLAERHKAEAGKIARMLKEAPHLDALSSAMDATMERRAALPKVTQDYLAKLYDTRRLAMEHAA